MSEHLPECAPRISNWGEDCICRYLQACERRLAALSNEAIYTSGYLAGIYRAREAVAALEPLLDRSKHEGGYDCCGCATVGYVWADALADIDALREQP